jgi:hypothetical protein
MDVFLRPFPKAQSGRRSRFIFCTLAVEQSQTRSSRGFREMSATQPEAEFQSRSRDVADVPGTDSCTAQIDGDTPFRQRAKLM